MKTTYKIIAGLLAIVLILPLAYLFNGANQQSKPNIILITLESTRADHLPCYGYHRDTTPNICEVAEDSILFENAYAQSS